MARENCIHIRRTDAKSRNCQSPLHGSRTSVCWTSLCMPTIVKSLRLGFWSSCSDTIHCDPLQTDITAVLIRVSAPERMSVYTADKMRRFFGYTLYKSLLYCALQINTTKWLPFALCIHPSQSSEQHEDLSDEKGHNRSTSWNMSRYTCPSLSLMKCEGHIRKEIVVMSERCM